MHAIIEDFHRKQISKALYIKNKAQQEIDSLELEISALKYKIKIQKSLMKQANDDIKHYST